MKVPIFFFAAIMRVFAVADVAFPVGNWNVRHVEGQSRLSLSHKDGFAAVEGVLSFAVPGRVTGAGGGVTFSGGEPLAQAACLLELIPLLKRSGVHLTLETSGAVDSETYRSVVSRMDFACQDLKHHDAEAFRKWTGGDLDVVLANVARLKTCGVAHVLQVPAVPGVNDTSADRAAILRIAADSPVEFLPYNRCRREISDAGQGFPDDYL